MYGIKNNYLCKRRQRKRLGLILERGIVSNNNKHIDYKSPVVQKYKTTQEVESELASEPIKKIEPIEKK